MVKEWVSDIEIVYFVSSIKWGLTFNQGLVQSSMYSMLKH
jgi:hypothetical protein